MRQPRIEILEYYHGYFNDAEFAGRLSTPKFGITKSKHTDGYYEHFPGRNKKGKIVLARRCFEDDELFDGTLLHEMIHQYQHEILNRKCNHDAIFTSMARRLERKYKVTVR